MLYTPVRPPKGAAPVRINLYSDTQTHPTAAMREALARTAALYPGRAVRIGAQQRLERFYAEFGFRTVSAPYEEDGIAHVEMLRSP